MSYFFHFRRCFTFFCIYVVTTYTLAGQIRNFLWKQLALVFSILYAHSYINKNKWCIYMAMYVWFDIMQQINYIHFDKTYIWIKQQCPNYYNHLLSWLLERHLVYLFLCMSEKYMSMNVVWSLCRSFLPSCGISNALRK